jgi:hypothetical protein
MRKTSTIKKKKKSNRKEKKFHIFFSILKKFKRTKWLERPIESRLLVSSNAWWK